MTFDIIPFSAKYLDAVEKLEQRCFSDPFTRTMLENALTNERSAAYVALCGNELAGYIELFDFVDSIDICTIETAPEYRRMGLARRFMQLAEEEASKRDVPVITLEVRISNAPAIALYEEAGFTRVGIRRNYYEKPREDAAVYFKHITEEKQT